MDESVNTKGLKKAASETNWSLYAKFKEGDPSAFHELFRKHKVCVINLAYRFVRDQEAAEDIAQDVLIKVYEKKVNMDPKAKFSTWLYRVTVNASIDYLRSKDNRFLSLDEKPNNENDKETGLEKIADPKSLSPLQILETEELQDLVKKGVDALPEKLRSCILLYQFEEMPYCEISKILGISEKAVERRLYHAKETLRKNLSKYLNC